MENVVLVKIWGKPVGTIMWNAQRKRAIFSYDKEFLNGGVDIAPLTASIHNPRYRNWHLLEVVVWVHWSLSLPFPLTKIKASP